MTPSSAWGKYNGAGDKIGFRHMQSKLLNFYIYLIIVLFLSAILFTSMEYHKIVLVIQNCIMQLPEVLVYFLLGIL